MFWWWSLHQSQYLNFLFWPRWWESFFSPIKQKLMVHASWPFIKLLESGDRGSVSIFLLGAEFWDFSEMAEQWISLYIPKSLSFFYGPETVIFWINFFLFAAVDCDDIEVVIALTYSDIVYTQISILYGCLFFRPIGHT